MTTIVLLIVIALLVVAVGLSLRWGLRWAVRAHRAETQLWFRRHYEEDRP